MYQLAGLYIVGAWLVIQVADISFPAWGVPETALRYLFIAAAACFPVALIFSWYYDITSKGIVRTEPAGASDTVDLGLKRADYIVLTALLAIGMAILIGSANKIQSEAEFAKSLSDVIERREHSIAVLPFVNLDTNPDTGFFSDGITEEILHRLSTLGALQVLASNSSFAYRDSDKSPTEISSLLGVRYLLQGSIRRDKDSVRVTARLVDNAGFQLWSESFDRKLESIFAIQTEIASTVSTKIINKIVPPEELPAGRTTTNMEAYNAYLRGNAFFEARTAGWKEKAADAYRLAIELDDGFAPPYAGLAIAMAINSGPGPQWEEARQLADKGLKLDPDLAEAHAFLGLVQANRGNHRAGTRSLRRALELDPSLAIAYNWISAPLYRMGLEAEADALQEKGLAIDPLNPPLIENVSSRESRAGNFDRAEQLILRLSNLPEPPQRAFPMLHTLYEDWGRLADALQLSKEHIRHHATADNPDIFEHLAVDYGKLGMSEDADYWKEFLHGRIPDDLRTLRCKLRLLQLRGANTELANELEKLAVETDFDDDSIHVSIKVFLALTSIQLGNYERGIEQMESAIPIDASELPRVMNTGHAIFVLHTVASAMQQVGRSKEALKILQDLERFLDIGNIGSGFFNPPGLESIALQRSLMGDKIGALQALQRAADIGWANYYDVINSPAWAETSKVPEFQALLSKVKTEVDRQRAIVEAADAEHDFRVEVERLLSN